MITFTFPVYIHFHFPSVCWSLSPSQCMITFTFPVIFLITFTFPVYVEFGALAADTIALTHTLGSTSSTLKWNILAQQIPCTATYRYYHPFINYHRKCCGNHRVFASIVHFMSFFCFATSLSLWSIPLNTWIRRLMVLLFVIFTSSNVQGTNRLPAVVHRLNRNSLQLQPSGRSGDSFKDNLVVGS